MLMVCACFDVFYRGSDNAKAEKQTVGGRNGNDPGGSPEHLRKISNSFISCQRLDILIKDCLLIVEGSKSFQNTLPHFPRN